MKLPFRLSSMIRKATREARRFGLSAAEVERLRADAVRMFEDAIARGLQADQLGLSMTTDKAGSVAIYVGDVYSCLAAASQRIERDAAFFASPSGTRH